jgi:thymidylate synthase
MNNIDKSYQALLQDILDNGVVKSDRTGTGTISVFGRQIRHKMSEGFPLLTTKKVHWNSIVTELLWFLRGDTNIKFLLDYDCHIWDGDCFANYVRNFIKYMDSLPENSETEFIIDKDKFINKIKTDETFAKQWGELGPVYGKQWRQWQGWMDMRGNEKGSLWYDQILQLVHSLKTNPDSRRLMVSAWNVAELDQMVLPPCHYGFQVYTRELDWKERVEIARNILDKEIFDEYGNLSPFTKKIITYWLNQYNIPTRAISLMWNQRSVDTFLGLPFNIASYALLLEIIAKEVNMVPEDLIGNLGDVHLYKNHIEQAKEQISREPYSLPKVEITERNWYQHQKVKENLGPKTFRDIILSYRPDCFELIGYESHPKIKAPLSN